VSEAYGLGRSRCFVKRLMWRASKCRASLYYQQPTSKARCACALDNAAEGDGFLLQPYYLFNDWFFKL